MIAPSGEGYEQEEINWPYYTVPLWFIIAAPLFSKRSRNKWGIALSIGMMILFIILVSLLV